MSGLDKLKSEAFKNPKVKDEYDRLNHLTLKNHMTYKGIQQKEVERDLTMLMRSYDRECEIMTANRLNGLRRGTLVVKPVELRALLEYSGNMIDSFRDEL